MTEELQNRIEQVKKTIEDIDKIFVSRGYSKTQVRNFLKEGKRLVDSDEIRFGVDGEITHFPEIPFITEIIFALVRGMKKIELIRLEVKAKEILRI